jgi:hypothetical protein
MAALEFWRHIWALQLSAKRVLLSSTSFGGIHKYHIYPNTNTVVHHPNSLIFLCLRTQSSTQDICPHYETVCHHYGRARLHGVGEANHCTLLQDVILALR